MPPCGVPLTLKTRREIFACLESYMLIFDRNERIAFANEHGIAITSFTDLTEEQGQMLLEAIEMAGPLPEPESAEIAPPFMGKAGAAPGARA